MARLRRVLVNLAAAFLIAFLYIALTDADWEAFTRTFFAVFIAPVVFLIGEALRTLTRHRTAGNVFVRLALIILLSFPMCFFAGRAYVHLQVWQVKRYVASELVPQLEQHRRTHGSYPRSVSSRAQSRDLLPAARTGDPSTTLGMTVIPRRLNYGSDGATYRLWMWDPLVCGHIWSYASQAGRWSESHDPCYY